jgi:hypothetical protein
VVVPGVIQSHESNAVLIPEAMPMETLAQRRREVRVALAARRSQVGTKRALKQAQGAGGIQEADGRVPEMWDPQAAAAPPAPKTGFTKHSSSTNNVKSTSRSKVMHLAQDLIKAHESAVRLQIKKLQIGVNELLMQLTEQPCACTTEVFDRYKSMGAASGAEKQLTRMQSQIVDLGACQCADSDEIDRPTAQPTPNTTVSPSQPTPNTQLWLSKQTNKANYVLPCTTTKMAMKLEQGCAVMEMPDDFSDAMDYDSLEDHAAILPLVEILSA